MKQRISAEDLAELTPEQREKLKKWWIPTTGDVVYNESDIGKPETPFSIMVTDRYDLEKDEIIEGVINPYNTDEFFDDLRGSVLPAMSIGQCIELLDYLKQCLVIRKKRGIWNCEETWGNSKVELIDALWQAVKEVL
ncbi:MAG: hypothetical protein PHE82_01245 [Syntrophomonadaceae bacterium]|nr:hypothetical protein [Syntrophomonadaceae bacterium]